MPAISVIMGVYNTNNKEMLSLSLNSILNQTFTDFEFIICDDGSTDGTYELIENLTKHDKRVILIRNKENRGLAETLNKCLKAATGKYIARMDADDVSCLERFEKQIYFLENNREFVLVGSNTILFNENGEWGYKNSPEKPDKTSFLYNSPFVHPSILIRIEELKQLGGYRAEKETLRCEDYDLFMRLYAKNMKGYNIQEPLLKYRQNNSTYKRRKYKYRIDEAKVRYKGFKMLGLMPLGIVYVIKPLIVGLLPHSILSILRNEKNVS